MSQAEALESQKQCLPIRRGHLGAVASMKDIICSVILYVYLMEPQCFNRATDDYMPLKTSSLTQRFLPCHNPRNPRTSIFAKIGRSSIKLTKLWYSISRVAERNNRKEYVYSCCLSLAIDTHDEKESYTYQWYGRNTMMR
jgi:hypothetical protein